MAECQDTSCSQISEQKSSSGITPQSLGGNKISILVLGKTGSGKSSIINAMLEEKVATTSSSSTPTEHESVEIHQKELDGVTVTMCDTRGFFDTEKREDVIFQNISSQCKEGFDLILICLKMTDKVDRSIKECLQKISSRFGKELWRRCIFVLTFTNIWLEYNDICGKSDNEKIGALVGQIDCFKKDVKEYARKIISEEIFDSIPFVLAGSIKSKQLVPHDNDDVTGSNDTERHVLAATEDWLNELWRVCYIHCKGTKKPLLNKFISKLHLRIMLELGGIGVTTAGGISIGAGVGGAIGSIVGGPIGLVVGAPIGAVIGTVASAVGSTTIVGIERMIIKSENNK